MMSPRSSTMRGSGRYRCRKAGVCVVFVVLGLASSGAFAGYGVEVVQGSERNVLNSSLEFDSSGRPTIAYGDLTASEVRLATKAGPVWNVETVDRRSPANLDHAADSNGNVLVCYTTAESGGNALYVAERVGSAWSSTRVARSVSSLAVSCTYDAAHVPCVAYADGSKLYFGKRSGGSWSSEVVAQRITVFGEVSLVFDTAGKPAIAFVDDQRSKSGQAYLRLARKPSAKWSIETAAGDSNSLRNASPAFHPASGSPLISYYVFGTAETRLATRPAGIWLTEPIAAGYGRTLKLDPAGNPHIGLRDSVLNTQVFVSSKVGGVWTPELVETSPNESAYATPSTALDPAGKPALSYSYRTDLSAPRDLRFASFSP